MHIRSPYVSSVEKANSVGGTSNYTSGVDVSAFSDLTFSTLNVAVGCAIKNSESFFEHKVLVVYLVDIVSEGSKSVFSLIKISS